MVMIHSMNSFAQKAVPTVDYKGHIHYDNKEIGTLSASGSVNTSGKSMTKVDGSGNYVDMNGKVLGKAPKNGDFTYYFNDKPEKFSIGKASHDGICKVTNSKGEVILLLHQSYKAQAACAIHCLYENHCLPSPNGKMEHKH